jgi:hypothetical protein
MNAGLMNNLKNKGKGSKIGGAANRFVAKKAQYGGAGVAGQEKGEGTPKEEKADQNGY